MKKIVSGLVIAILVFGMFTSFNVKVVMSTGNDWWNQGWLYRRQINISEKSGYSLINFPIEVSFRHGGHAQPDGRDIRVIDNSVEIPSYVEECNSTHVKVIFQINLTALESKTIYIYYGNSEVIAPNYPLIPLSIFEGNNGNATIDNRILIGWEYTYWGVKPGWYIVGGNLVYIDNNNVVLWTKFAMDFDGNGKFDEDEDLITDFDVWKGGIGRFHMQVARFVERSFGLGNYQGFIRTPIYVEIIFQNATLRVYKGHNFVEATQADRLQMGGTLWDYARYKGGLEENIIDGLNTNGPPDDPTWNTLYSSSANPGWMAFRNSLNGYVFGAIGLNINSSYMYHFSAKESHAYDRFIFFDYTINPTLNPYDQPVGCKIYWYADGSNGYSEINKTASILSNPPTISVFTEEVVPEFPSTAMLFLVLMSTAFAVIIGKKGMFRKRLRKY